MAQDQQSDFQYVKLPDGSYGKFAGNAPDEQISAQIAKDFPGAIAAQSGTQSAAPQTFEEKYVAPQMAPPNEGLGHHIMRGASNFGGGVIGGVTSPFLHPIETAKSVFSMSPVGMAYGAMHGDKPPGADIIAALKEHPEETIESGLGSLVGGIDTGGLVGEAMPALSKVGSAMRSAAIGDPDAAALRGMRVGPASPKALSTIRATQGARPFLQGAQSLADVQARIPGAKSEIWGPYQKTIDAIGDKPVTGPDGPTTVRELEAERQQLSAINRQLKSRTPSPEAVKLAEQKGLNQAQALQRERAVQNALDPVLRDAGIQPKAIRQAFGQVSQIGERVSGKTTLAEPKQPYGFGKIANLSIEHPFQAPAQILSGVRDLAAGRPWWSGSPTDVSLREAFRPGAMKPDFGAFRPETLIPRGAAPRMLEANVPGNAPYGEEPYPGSMNGMPERNPVRVTPFTPPRGLLPSVASEGEAQPMFRFARPYQEPFDPNFKPVDLKEYFKFRPKAK